MPLLTEEIAKSLLHRLSELRADVGRANLLQSYEALGYAYQTLGDEAQTALERQEQGRR